MVRANAKIDADGIRGFVNFKQHCLAGPVRVSIFVRGLPDGAHGIHVHEASLAPLLLTDDETRCCDLLGGHFCIAPAFDSTHPNGIPHGSYEKKNIRHTGDLCNNIVSAGGLAEFEYDDTLISIVSGHPANVVGRSIVIHEGADDCGFGGDYASKVTGNSGARLACAQIKKYVADSDSDLD
jgi:Cu-Zn family superoxide dismutase